MTDFHIHSNYSFDSDEKLSNIVTHSIKKGLATITITDHFEFKDGVLTISKDNLLRRQDEIETLKHKYSSQIKILTGLEIGFVKEKADQLAKAIAPLRLDYVINSVHEVKGYDCYDERYYIGKDKHTAYLDYFNAVLHSLDAPYPYNTIGHLGYVSRMAPYTDTAIYYNDFKDILDKILTTIIKKEKALELNSNAKSSTMPHIPNLEILTAYKNLNGKKVAFGSDAHCVERIGEWISEVKVVADKMGFSLK